MSDLTPIDARREMQAYLEAPTPLQHLTKLLSGKGIEPGAFIAAVAADAMRQPKLALAIRQAPETLMEQLTVAAATGLLPGASYGQFYLIPRWNGKANRTEVTSITGYKGLCDVAYRHPRVHSVESQVVFKGEEFDYEPGTGTIRHKWNGDVARDALEDIHCVYAMVTLATPDGQHVEGRPLLHVMTLKEILKARARSASAQSGFSPWKTDPIPMARKTPLRRLLGGGSVPRLFDLIALMGHESRVDEIVEPEASSGTTGQPGKSSRPSGIAGLKASLTVLPDAPQDLGDARAELAKLTADLPDGIDPSMMSDDDVLRALEFYRNR